MNILTKVQLIKELKDKYDEVHARWLADPSEKNARELDKTYDRLFRAREDARYRF